MTRPLVVSLSFLASLLVASNTFAAVADLSVSLGAPPYPDAFATHVVSYPVTVANAGPDATNAQLTIGASARPAEVCNGGGTLHLEPNATRTILCYVDAPGESRRTTLTAHVAGDASDPNPANNDATVTFDWLLTPNVQVVIPPVVLDPGLSTDVVVQWRNVNPLPATNVVLTIIFPPDLTVTQTPDGCNVAGSIVTCNVPNLSAGSSDSPFESLHLGVSAPDRREGFPIVIEAAIHAEETEADPTDNRVTLATSAYRTFVVETTANSGAGSLRAAIESANTSCPDDVACRIAFRLPTPDSSGYRTITPATPLPLITRNVSIDGGTQTRLTGDTNPDGPEIFLDGSRLAAGNGFTTSCQGEFASLAVGNFPDNGILVAPQDLRCIPRLQAIRSSYIGVDPGGHVAAPNGRGIFVERGNGGLGIRTNVISGNRHSGIFLAGSSTLIVNNVIGLDARHAAPLGNGASGVYVGGLRQEWALIRGNYIAFNHDFGIGIGPTSVADIFPNAIFANWQMAIDRGLDGPSRGAPVITSAVYDPATNTTAIDLTITIDGSFDPTLQFYAADAPHASGQGEAQYYLGTLRTSSKSVHFAASGDWRGKWVAATVTQHIYDGGTGPEYVETTSLTSELSSAFAVH